MPDIRLSGFSLPYTTGTTENRPAAPAEGTQYFNTTIGGLQIYVNGQWATHQKPTDIIAPTGVTATNSGTGRAFNNGRASVAFTRSELGGPVSSYVVTSNPGSYTQTGTSSPILITGLQSGTSYTYTVAASNSYSSATSSASAAVTATTVPQAPSISASGGNALATITITPGGDGGSAITGYSIVSNPATTTQTTSSTTYTFTGLTNDTSYTFIVTATNANGTSAASSASSSVTPTAAPVLSGGVLTSDATYYYRTFTGTSSLSVSNTSITADILIGAGGGSGGVYCSGGGGAGGVIAFSSQVLTPGSHVATVGGGAPGASTDNGNKGINSTFGALTAAEGGGYGAAGAYETNGGPGGCGGGASGADQAIARSGGTGSQGYAGGSSSQYGAYYQGCGGGGMGGIGGDRSGQTTGAGGAGTNTITNWGNLSAMFSSTGLGVGGYIAGGGSGGGYNGNGSVGAAGSGGATSGSVITSTANATANSSSGSGGAYTSPGSGNGGSGFVVVRYTRASVGG